MRYLKICSTAVIALSCMLMFPVFDALADEDRYYPHPDTYAPTRMELDKAKSMYDDPRPFMVDMNPLKILPKVMIDDLTFDVDEMKKQWSELVGFKAPDLVGKIAPHIKPGKYTYQNVQNDPEFQKLFPPELLDQIGPAGPPNVGKIAEFTIIPTQQYYWSLPICEATRRNLGKTKLDEDGYIIVESWESGYPFPKPSGKHKAMQVMYNYEKRQFSWGQSFWHYSKDWGYTKSLAEDSKVLSLHRRLQLGGRCAIKPYGFIDEIAEKKREFTATQLYFPEPRDSAGLMGHMKLYQDPDAYDVYMMYIPSLRRIRKMSTSDRQDPMLGSDAIYDDINYKISKVSFPFKYEITDEREYLVLSYCKDGSEYFDKENKGYHNVVMERRPYYRVKMTQLDPSYVYSTRILYVDKETFIETLKVSYDQKGRLYRYSYHQEIVHPEMGMTAWCRQVVHDRIDTHSTINMSYQLPASWKRMEMTLHNQARRK